MVKKLIKINGTKKEKKKEKESTSSVGDAGSIPRSRRFHGEANGNLLQYSCLENSIARGDWSTGLYNVGRD